MLTAKKPLDKVNLWFGFDLRQGRGVQVSKNPRQEEILEKISLTKQVTQVFEAESEAEALEKAKVIFADEARKLVI